jgi:hypothetical protein
MLPFAGRGRMAFSLLITWELLLQQNRHRSIGQVRHGKIELSIAIEVCFRDLVWAVPHSISGSLSPDGSLLAGAKDNSILAQTQSGDGVWIWDTSKLAAKCLSTSPPTK